jgi:DNA-binding CsgD family transcriptional regulator
VTAVSEPDRVGEARSAERALVELLELERELLELRYVRRADALERAGEAVRRLGEATAADGILRRAAIELGSSSEFDRVLISELDAGELRPLALYCSDDPSGAEQLVARLRDEPVRLEYPLVEYEVARDREARLVRVQTAGARSPRRWASALGWDGYAVAALTAGGDTIGLLHADTGGRGRPLDAVHLETAATYADGLSGALERAVLRHTLALHRAQLSSAAQWMGTRVEQLSDFSSGPRTGGPGRAGSRAMESLTPRELDVLRLLARGLTNLAIANALVVREGTVKYHVKNILRKLGATSRSDAVARFVRANAGDPTP